MCSNGLYKKIISSNPFALVNINDKIHSNFQKEWFTFGRKKRCLKKIKTIHFQGLSALNMQELFLFVSSFEHVKFVINVNFVTHLGGSFYYDFTHEILP
jgi:hypothetical protein